MSPSLFDAHLQADGLTPTDLRSMAAFGVRAALLPAHDGLGAVGAEALLAHFRDLTQEHPGRLARAGIHPYVALGVAPGSLPEHDLDQVLDLLPRFVGPRPARVVALGQLGLGEGGPAREHAFARQLELARELGLPALVQLPARGAERALRRTLGLLRESGLPPERVLLGRVRPDLLPAALGCGHWARVGLRAGRAPLAELVEHVQRLGAHRLLLGSDAGDGHTDILAVARACDGLERAGLKPAVVRRVALENALELLGIDPARVREDAAPARAARS